MQTCRSSFVACAAGAVLWQGCAPSRAAAQEHVTTVEVGAQVSALQLLGRSGAFTFTPGLGGRLDVYVAPTVAAEAQVSWFPEDSLSTAQSQGGRTLELSVGARAKFFSSDHASIYASAAPGLLRFTRTTTGAALRTGPPATRSATRFGLTTGVGLELYPSDRWAFHIEAGDVMYANPGVRGITPGSPAAVAPVISDVRRVTTGLAYRPGRQHPRPNESGADAARWQVGGELTGRVAASIAPDVLSPQRTPAAGLFASYRLFEYVDLDAAADAGLANDAAGSRVEGRHVVQVLVGGKVGVRRNRFGMFVKLRGGVQTGALVYDTIDAFRLTTYTRGTTGAFDIGGVLETYVSPRLLVRMDASDVQSAHGSPTVIEAGRTIGPGDTPAAHSIQISIGAGVRF